MNFLKKIFRDKQSRKTISFFSTDNNVLCENGKYLRENINQINNNLESINTRLNVLENSTKEMIK